jgi:hypothetical protein
MGIVKFKLLKMTKVYNVSYDLNKGKDYPGLHAELEKTFEWYHLLDSTWLLHTTESAEQIWNRLKTHVDNDDNILIAQITSNNYGWLPKYAWDWLNARVKQFA